MKRNLKKKDVEGENEGQKGKVKVLVPYMVTPS